MRTRSLAAGGLAVAAAAALFWASAATRATDPAMPDHRMPAAAPSGTPAETVAAAPNQVIIDDFAFAPKTLTVAAGTEVVWVNRDDEPHTVVDGSDAKRFKSAALDTGDKFAFVFKTPGTYLYYCTIHPHMTGTIVVK
ncbi:MAG TPA: cupredoxin family copper-binding protein [Stellaceae bacterium]|jgi:plastocyanin|nr:cupredoxin family copper-binding protein [Stellaceae bacterium]